MKPLSSIATALLGAALIAAGGCGGDGGTARLDPDALESVFQDAPAEAAPVEAAEQSTTDTIRMGEIAASEVPVKQLATQAAEAIRRDDVAEAMVLLENLRRARTLSPQQLTAVQDQMAAFQTEIARRAEAGDVKAQQAMELMRQKTRW